MGLAIISLLTGLAISAVAIYYSVAGLTAIFAAAAVPIMVMGVALEIAKLVATVWLKQNWKIAPSLIKAYLVAAVGVLMFITSMGIFGFLSKAHSDQSLVSGDVQSKIAIYDQKIQTSKDNIEANRKALKQMDEAVDQSMARSTDEKGADKAVAIRRSQQKERTRLLSEITQEQKTIAQLNDEAAPIRAEVRKVEAEVGPIKYIAAFVYGDNPDANVLERAVTWVIVIIVFVFDPLAVVLLLAAQYSFARIGIAVGYEKEGQEKVEEEREARLTLAQRISGKIKGFRQYVSDSVDSLKSGFKSPLEKPEGDSQTKGDPNVVEETPVTDSFGVIAQEVAEVLPEAVLVEDSKEILDDAKAKLEAFREALVNAQPEPLKFAQVDTNVKGFYVPKVYDVKTPTNFANSNLNVPTLPKFETEETFGITDVSAWNKMLEEAERAVEQEHASEESEIEFPENPFNGQQYTLKDKAFIFNGDHWIQTTLSGQGDLERPGDYLTPPEDTAKFKILPELINSNNYVQNEEQTESNLWNEVTNTLSQQDYQDKVQLAVVKELVEKINSGEIKISELNDTEFEMVNNYLTQFSDVSKNNPDQSA